jgi:hypothetical protein
MTAVVDAARGDVALLESLAEVKALVVAEVEVGLRAVVGHEDFTVLEGVHGAGVDVDVGIEFHHGDAQAARLRSNSPRLADRRPCPRMKPRRRSQTRISSFAWNPPELLENAVY